MEEIPRKRPGRPRKVVPDAQGSGEVQVASGVDGDDREADFVAADPDRTPAPSRWAELIQKIGQLADSGHYVTQVHTRDNRSGTYETANGDAAMHGNAESDFVVTSDGVKHPV